MKFIMYQASRCEHCGGPIVYSRGLCEVCDKIESATTVERCDEIIEAINGDIIMYASGIASTNLLNLRDRFHAQLTRVGNKRASL